MHLRAARRGTPWPCRVVFGCGAGQLPYASCSGMFCCFIAPDFGARVKERCQGTQAAVRSIVCAMVGSFWAILDTAVHAFGTALFRAGRARLFLSTAVLCTIGCNYYVWSIVHQRTHHTSAPPELLPRLGFPDNRSLLIFRQSEQMRQRAINLAEGEQIFATSAERLSTSALTPPPA